MKKTIFILIIFCFFNGITYINCNVKKNNAEKTQNLKKDLKIGYWTSWNVKCGIAMYAQHIINELKKDNYKVFIYSNKMPLELFLEQLKKDKINVLNIQYDPFLFHWGSDVILKNLEEFILVIRQIKKMGIKIIITVHIEIESKKLIIFADQLIYTRRSQYFENEKINLIPIGVPNFEPRYTKEFYRKKYGFKKEDKILTTMGFMLEPKKFSKVLERLITELKKNKNYKVQLLTAFTNRDANLYKQSLEENAKIKEIIKNNNIEDQVMHITRFLTQAELTERLWLSDLGYLWGDNSSNASSASIKEFVSARLPLIATDSKRYLYDDIAGIIKVSENFEIFVNTIFETINKNKMLKKLSIDLEKYYISSNYNKQIEKHLNVFKKTLYKNNAKIYFH